MTGAGRASIAAYDEFYTKCVPPFVAACNAFDDLKEIASFTEAAFKNQGDLVKAAAVSKKPSDADLLAFLKTSADVIQKSDKMNFKSPQYTHQQAFNASIGVLSWPFAQPPSSHIEGMIDSGSMYCNRILMKAKDAEEPQKSQDRAFVSTFKALLTGFFEFVKSNFKAGVEWNNVKGKALTEAKAAPAAPAAAAPPAPKVAASTPAPAAAKPAGMAALFGELNRGLAITSGLNRVTDDMKTKNQKDVAPLPAAPKPAAPKPKLPAGKAPITKDPIFENKNGSWYLEYQQDNHALEVKDVAIRDGVYVGHSRNSTVKITGKPKSVAIDNCFRVTVYLEDTLSSVEFVNCDRCTVYIAGTCPTIAIDKSKGIVMNLSEKALACNPDIVTSNISECNIQIPGPSEEENITEIPLYEQYINKIVGRKTTSVPVTHG